MPKRFEVVAAPVEELIQEGLKDQALLAFTTARHIFDSIEARRCDIVNNTRGLLDDDEFVARVVDKALILTTPSSLPGFLFLFAVILRVLHFVALKFVCTRAVERQNRLVLDECEKTD